VTLSYAALVRTRPPQVITITSSSSSSQYERTDAFWQRTANTSRRCSCHASTEVAQLPGRTLNKCICSRSICHSCRVIPPARLVASILGVLRVAFCVTQTVRTMSFPHWHCTVRTTVDEVIFRGVQSYSFPSNHSAIYRCVLIIILPQFVCCIFSLNCSLAVGLTVPDRILSSVTFVASGQFVKRIFVSCACWCLV
jgi:hypothetical protein